MAKTTLTLHGIGKQEGNNLNEVNCTSGLKQAQPPLCLAVGTKHQPPSTGRKDGLYVSCLLSLKHVEDPPS